MTASMQPTPGRSLSDDETAALLDLDIPAHLATLDRGGFPRITPLWFLWHDGAFYMTSVVGRKHLHDLARNPCASICIDTEEHIAVGGIRQNQQIKARGHATLTTDDSGQWTTRITLKYIHDAEGEIRAARRAAMPRMLIMLRPDRLICIGTPRS